MLLNTYPQKDAETNFQHAARQTYIAFMAAIAQAAYEDVEKDWLANLVKVRKPMDELVSYI